MFCDIAIPRTHLDKLTYRFDPDSIGKLRPGDCVQVSFRGKPIRGIVVGLRGKSPVRNTLMVEDIVEHELVSAELLSLVDWMAQYYRAWAGEVLSFALPSGICGYKPRAVRNETGTQARFVGKPSVAHGGVAFDRFGVYFSGQVRNRLEPVMDFVSTALCRGAVILLLPEVRLKDWLPSLAGRFGPELAEYHSGMTITRRKQIWQRIHKGRHRIIIGTRSAVFAPVEKLGGIVIVDGHDPVYKEERHPRFHARDVAITRAQIAGCPVLLCDRTPSAETWLKLRTGKYLCLAKTVTGHVRRSAFIVDMRRHPGKFFSPRLVRELGQVGKSGVSILYVNRRGMSRNVVCKECGTVLECPECKVPLILGADGTLLCRFCGRTVPAPESCPGCSGTSFSFRSPGLDMVSKGIARQFPETKVDKVTADAGLLLPLEKGTVVVGTKALFSQHWPEQTRLVSAVCFDYDLVVPDFRSRERAFQTLFEMERRAAMLKARFVVQTWRPDDPAVRYAVSQDMAGFMEQELKMRKELGFPPFRQLILIEFYGSDEAKMCRHTKRIVTLVRPIPGIEALGPVEPRNSRRRRWSGKRAGMRVLIKAEPGQDLSRVLDRSRLETSGISVRIDVDPLEIV